MHALGMQTVLYELEL